MGRASWTRGQGPLAPFAAGLRRELQALGYAPSSVKGILTLIGQLNRWLATEDLGVSELTAGVVQRFLDARRSRGSKQRVPTLRSLTPLFDHLYAEGALAPPEPVPATPLDELLVRYHRHLVHDRGLAPSTVRRYEEFARRFLAARAARHGTPTGAENLSSGEVHAFMLEASARLVVESAKREAADLRALLRFLYSDGLLETDLGTAMPPVAVWRGGPLPPTMPLRNVEALLASCDRSTRSGRWAYAILMLLARLGLRCGEIVGLELKDIDWRRGEITVRGKGRRTDRLPLPVAVGEALVDYLQHARPGCRCPQVFTTRHAPPRPMHRRSINDVVYGACRRAGIARVSAHCLRHALATEMLRQGADLIEIAQVLRHSDLGTTSGYAKVDRVALRTLAQPWPVAVR
jgi:integrase/recombinase XerD